VDPPDGLGHHCIGDLACAGSTPQPLVIAAGRDAQDTAEGMHACAVGVGLVRIHEFVDGVDVFSLLAANQAVAFARMSRSCCTWRSCRRRRTSSSRSVPVRPYLPGSGFPRSRASCAIQLAMLCAVGPNSRDNSAGVRPARASSIIC